MKIGLAQLNTTVGDLSGNYDKIVQAYQTLVENGAELVICPELVVSGYPPRDLLFKSRFVSDCWESVKSLAGQTGDIPLLIGFPEHNQSGRGRPFFNSAAWCLKGEVCEHARKMLLPTYDVFDEERYFESAEAPLILDWKGQRIGITICEDIWVGPDIPTSRHYQQDPVAALEKENLDLLLNLSASPWHFGKGKVREDLVRSAARRCGCPVVYCNAVGGNDELIFDGQSLTCNGRGERTGVLNAFEACIEVLDTETRQDPLPETLDDMEAAYRALTLGLRDYAHKSGFEKALLGLSGGIDSSVVAVIATEALGKDNVLGISNPSAISSQHSREDAATLASNLNISLESLPISDIVQAYETTLEGLFEGTEPGVAEENIQARARGALWMAISNKFGRLLLTCGNKSELAVGYCTLYGDMCGGLAVISDVPKMKVYELAQWINREREIIPVNVIRKAPSAELRPDQKDEDSLPPYPVLDAILKAYVEEGQSSTEIIAKGFDPIVVRDIIRKVDLNEYKRKQAAPGLKITPLAFGVGRRIPIVQKYVS